MEQTMRARAIEDALKQKLAAEHVEVIDDSVLHEGHPGARDGGGHFRIVVVSEEFRGLSRVAAQRLVYGALAELMAGEIHALQMRTFTPERWSAATASPTGRS